MDLPPETLSLLRTMAVGSLAMWALLPLLLLHEVWLKRSKWVERKIRSLSRRNEGKPPMFLLKMDHVLIKLAQTFFLISSPLSAAIFLYHGFLKTTLTTGIFFLAWILVPFYFTVRLVSRVDKTVINMVMAKGQEKG